MRKETFYCELRMEYSLVFLGCLVLSTSYTVFGASVNSASGNFRISDNGVQGVGTYLIANGTAEIGLSLRIGLEANSQSDPGTAIITSAAPVLTPEDNQFIDEMVTVHNELRSVHFSPPLQNNTNMSKEAKKHAILLAELKELNHSANSSRPGQGESLAMGCTTAPGEGISAEEAVMKWYEEACCHNFSLHRYQNTSGHFSQLVWKATEEIGVGRAFGTKWGMNCTFIVARYKPNGNINNEASFTENVERGTFDPLAYNCSSIACEPHSEKEIQVKDEGQNDHTQENAKLVEYQATQNVNSGSDLKRPDDYKNAVENNGAQELNHFTENRATPDYKNQQEINIRKEGGDYHEDADGQRYNTGQNAQGFVSRDSNVNDASYKTYRYRAEIPRIERIRVL